MLIREKSLLIVVGLTLIGSSFTANAQMEDLRQVRYRRATQELDLVLDQSRTLDPIRAVKVRCRAANLLWLQAPERARALFIELWDLIDKESAKPGFPTEDARTAVLTQIYPRDSRLAKELIQKAIAKNNVNDQGSLSFNRISGKDADANRLARMAFRLVDSDTTLAVEVLEQSLAQNTAPQSIVVLSRVRESDALLANYVARRMLQNLSNQPRTIAVVGATHLISYIFPLMPSPPATLEIGESDESLRSQFMATAYQILRDSLEESEQTLKETYHLSAEALSFRTYAQALLSETLTVLSARYAPNLTPELRGIAFGLMTKLPAPMAQAARTQAAVAGSTADAFDDSEKNETGAILSAIAKGEFNRARELIAALKDERSKKTYTQQLLKAEFKSYLGLSELEKALKIAILIDDSSSRMQMLAQLAKIAHQKNNLGFSSDVLREARKTAVDPNRKGIHIRALFALAAETAYFAGPDALLVLQDAVKQINELSADANQKVAPLNDPNSFLDSNELVTAFSRVGKTYVEEALNLAAKIDNQSVQQMARIAAVERILAIRPIQPQSKSVDTNRVQP